MSLEDRKWLTSGMCYFPPQTPRHSWARSATEDGVAKPLCTSLTPPRHVRCAKGLSVHKDSSKGWSGKP